MDVGTIAEPSAPESEAALPFTRADIEGTIPARFEMVARRHPNGVALTGGGRQWTYAELNRQAGCIAEAIQRRTGTGQACIAYLMDISPEMVVATLAILGAGKTCLALHPKLPAAALAEVIWDTEPELILTTASLASRLEALPGGPGILVIENGQLEGSEDGEPPAVAPCDPAVIYYTSGTTGRPKAVVKSHRAVLHRVWLSTQYDRIVPEDRQSLLTHACFASAEADIFCALLQGARVCVYDIASAGFGEFRQWIDAEGITLLHPPALLFRRFLSTLRGENLFPAVRLVALAGDVILPADVTAWRRLFSPSCELLCRFSTTETALLTVAQIQAGGLSEDGVLPAGTAVPGKHLELVDESGKKVAVGEVGELVVRSAYLADGYWRRPVETEAVFTSDVEVPGRRMYRTGDFGRFVRDGDFVFVGRRDHQVKIRGYRVDIREVESVVQQVQGVAEAAIVVEQYEEESRLAAFVVMETGAGEDAIALRDRLRTELPEWQVPARIEFLSSLPVTLTGKVDRGRLREIGRDPNRVDPGDVRNGESIEEEVAGLLQEALRVADLRYDEHFLDAGGDSITAMLVLNRVAHRWGIRMAPADLHRNGSVRALAGRIRTRLTRDPRWTAAETVSGRLLNLVSDCGAEYAFINPGTGTAPIQEAFARLKGEGKRTPELILCLHEAVALAAAHGHYQVSGRPQAVLVHADVGTLNLGANLHSAQRGRAGIVIFAGRSPYTVDGSSPGGRDKAVHWVQDQYHQASVVAGYVKWSYELTRKENLDLAVRRAFQLAGSAPPGPVYLTMAREVLMEAFDEQSQGQPVQGARSPEIGEPEARGDSVAQAAEWLIEAERPLILTGYAGRHPETVSTLVSLAETLAIPVIESRYRVNFPFRHPLHLGFLPGRWLQQADCVLVLDHDVPWVPAEGRPRPGCRIIHVDIDPLKRDIPLWGFPVDLSMHAGSGQALRALTGKIREQLKPEDHSRIDARRLAVSQEHEKQRALWRARAQECAKDQPIAPEWAAHCLREIVDENTLIVSEAITNNPVLWRQLELDTPGTYFQSLGSGLGWGLGAALGAKLAAPEKLVICVVGDGSWVFGSPIAAYAAAVQSRAPFLTVIFNNHSYAATKEAIFALGPGEIASESSGFPACELPGPGVYGRIGEALGLWASTVSDPGELKAVLLKAAAAVRGGQCALVDVSVAGSP